ncbi:MAG: HAD family hydrolase [bacterium]|nr:HAD family hydrolase [bacterium]
MKNPKHYDAIIFDVDGTLWNATAATAQGLEQALRELGLSTSPITAADVERVTGNPIDVCVKAWLPHVPESTFPTLIPLFASCEQAIVEREGGQFYEGVQAGLRTLASRFSLYLVSNCQHRYLDGFLAHCQARSCLKDWDCFGLSQCSKQDMLITMQQKHAIQNGIYIGDTRGDHQAATGAHLDFGYAQYGFGEIADYTPRFPSFQHLLSWFL